MPVIPNGNSQTPYDINTVETMFENKKNIKCKIDDIESLTLENFQPRIDLAGLLTYSCFATFPNKSVV